MEENIENTNKRRLRLTDEERAISNKNRRDRMKIANMVRRKPELEKICCICGRKNADIVHNKKDPYVIAFLCHECRLNSDNLAIAEKRRFDIRTVMNKSTLSAKNFSSEDVKTLVENYLMETLSIGKYCKKIKISRHQFNQLMERYKDMYNDPSIRRKIINHANHVNRNTLSEEAYTRNGF